MIYGWHEGRKCGVGTSLFYPLAPSRNPTTRAHSAHVMLSVLAVMEDLAARQLYDKLRNAFNQTLPPESLPLPPLEEWQGISAHCDHFYCRWI